MSTRRRRRRTGRERGRGKRRKKKKKRAKKIFFEDIMAENFPDMMQNTNLYTQFN